MVYYSPNGEPPRPANPPQKPTKGKLSRLRMTLIVVGSIVGVFVVVPLTAGNDQSTGDDTAVADPVVTSSSAAATKAPAAKKPAPTTYAIGQPVKSKKFEYVVTGYECGIPTVGKYEITQEVAKGQFCKLAITAKNIAKRAEDLDFDDFKLMAGDLEYSTDSWVNITASDDTDSSGFYDKINPGLQVAGNIFFDVPKGVTPDRVMINDTIFGKPATVTLKK